MKKPQLKPPKPCVRWGLFDSAGEFVLESRARSTALGWNETRWYKVRIAPIARKLGAKKEKR
jgi:hypothetical protein